MDRKIKVIINVFVTLLLLTIIIYYVGYKEVTDAIVEMNWSFFLIAFVFWLLLNMVISIRIWKILAYLGHKIPYMEVFLSHMTGMFLSDFTPARVGYFGIAALFKKEHNIPVSKGIMSVLGPQLFEFLWKIVISFILLFLIIDLLAPENIELLIFFGVIAIACIIAILSVLISKRVLNTFSFAEKIPVVSYGYNIIKKLHEHGHAMTSKWKVIWLTIITAWILKGLEWIFVAYALNIHLYDSFLLELIFYGCFQSFVFFIHFIPFPTLAGTGISEGITAGILVLFGISPVIAVSFAILARVDSVIIDVILGSFKITKVGLDTIFSITKPVKF